MSTENRRERVEAKMAETPRSDTRTLIAAVRKIADRCERDAMSAADDGAATDAMIHASALREAANRMEEMRLALLPFAWVEETMSSLPPGKDVSVNCAPAPVDDSDDQGVFGAGTAAGWSRLRRRCFREAKRLVADKGA